MADVKVYQATGGQWIVFSKGIKSSYLTEAAALAMASKIVFTENVLRVATNLAIVFNEAEDLRAQFFDEGYNGPGADPIIDADIVSLGVTAAEVNSFITMAVQLQNFADNAPVISADYDKVVNALRTDL